MKNARVEVLRLIRADKRTKAFKRELDAFSRDVERAAARLALYDALYGVTPEERDAIIATKKAHPLAFTNPYGVTMTPELKPYKERRGLSWREYDRLAGLVVDVYGLMTR